MFHPSRSIATRLSLVMCLVFSLYLGSVSAIGYVMFNQYQGFSKLASSQFDRALAAAELTRDAEIIAAEVFESLVGNSRSTQFESSAQRVENLAELYKRARENLRSKAHDNPAAELAQQDIDHWQTPFFQSLDALDQHLEREQALDADAQSRFDQLFLLQRQIPTQTSDRPAIEQKLYFYALAALSYTNTALNAERPGQLAQLEQNSRHLLEKLNALPLTTTDHIRLRNQLNEQLPAAFASRKPYLNNARATLATARQTRLLAQKLTSATYNYHLQLKAQAQQAITEHQQLIRRSLLGLILAGALLIVITLAAAFYIRRTLVNRLRLLSASIQAHMIGSRQPIPESGDDEISEMGHAFAVFVQARQRAEQQLAEANQHLKQMNDELHTLSEIDALTQIANRRSFDIHLNKEWRRALRAQHPVSIIMADVDFFKRYNDRYGHPVGDECLYRVAQVLQQNLHREGDLLARYGGEEFIFLLPDTDLAQASKLAAKLLGAVAALAIPHQSSEHDIVTVSMGISSVTPTPQTRTEDLIHQADEALYAAKSGGRNRYCLAKSTTEQA